MKIFKVALLSLLLISSALAQEIDPVVEKVIQEGRENSKVTEHLVYLVEEIGPRLTSSDNLTEACEWTRGQFESFGLEARLEEWGTFPVGFNRGPWSGKMIAPEERELTFGTHSWTAGTNGPVTAAAFLMTAETDTVKAEDLKGAWVLIRERLSRKQRQAVQPLFDEAGIAGTIQRVGDLIETSGNSRITWDKLPRRPVINMVKSDFDAIAAHLEQGTEVKLTFDIKNEFKQGPIKLYNVIADLKGTEKPDEYVVVGGHIDSWDGAKGCVDNGTGCATTLEAARLLIAAGAKPKRTIRFMLWGGEEQGLLGSASFVRKHKEEMAKYSACLVHDGGTNYVAGIGGTEAMIPSLEKVFAPVMNLDEKLKFKVRKVRTLSAFGASDHASFCSAGVPGFFWDQKGRANYNHAHHTQHDNLDQAIEEYQRHSAVVIAVGAYGIANLDELLPREGVGARTTPAGEPRMLGVQMDDEQEGKVVLTEVVEDSAAEKAGLKVGDQILKLAGTVVTDQDGLREAIQAAPKKTTVLILRNGAEQELAVEFADAAPARRRRLGVNLDEGAEGGLTITSITEGSVAAESGLKEGDEILKFDGAEVADIAGLIELMQAAKPETTIVIRRGGKEMELPVKFAVAEK